LMGEHTGLAAMMGVVGEHVGEHRWTGGPGLGPTVAVKTLNELGRGREGVGKHFGATGGAVLEGGAGLLWRASCVVEGRGDLQMRCG